MTFVLRGVVVARDLESSSDVLLLSVNAVPLALTLAFPVDLFRQIRCRFQDFLNLT